MNDEREKTTTTTTTTTFYSFLVHQRHGNRIMQEALLGQTNIQRIRGEIKTNE